MVLWRRSHLARERVEEQIMLRAHAGELPDSSHLGPNVVTKDGRRARGGGEEPGQQTNRGGLARTIRPEQRRHLATWQSEAITRQSRGHLAIRGNQRQRRHLARVHLEGDVAESDHRRRSGKGAGDLLELNGHALKRALDLNDGGVRGSGGGRSKAVGEDAQPPHLLQLHLTQSRTDDAGSSPARAPTHEVEARASEAHL